MRITAAVLRAPELAFSIEDLDLEGPGPGEALVQVAGVGFCHTDLFPRTPWAGVALPLVAGHEGAGVVQEVGPAVSGTPGIAPGDRVVMSFDACGTCRACLASRPANCATFFPRNLSGRRCDGSAPVRDGSGRTVASGWFGQSSFATHALVPVRNLVPVPAGLPTPPLELLGTLGCGFQTGAGAVFHSLRVRPASSLVIGGVGAVGLAAVMAARAAGATTVVAVDRHVSRLRLAAGLGATHTLHPRDGHLADRINEVTGGGADHALDTTGSPAVIAELIRGLHSHGTCGLVGVQHGDLAIDPLMLATGRCVKGIIEGDAVPRLFLPRLLDLWHQGLFPFDRLVRTYPLQAIAEAEKDVDAGTVVKAVLLPA